MIALIVGVTVFWFAYYAGRAQGRFLERRRCESIVRGFTGHGEPAHPQRAILDWIRDGGEAWDPIAGENVR